MRRFSRRSLDEDAFTLIELLVVVLIIGILAAIAIPVLLDQRVKAYRDAVVSDVRNGSLFLEGYYANNIAYPPVGPIPGFVSSNGVSINIMASDTVGYCLEASHVGLDEDGDGTPDPYYFETRTLKAMSAVAAGSCV